MKVGNDTLTFIYGSNGHPMAVKYNYSYYYYVTNTFGDVLAILDDDGAEVVTYTYDAWGNILTTGGSMASTLGAYNPLRYRGYVYDRETGLYYLQSRYYNPTIGRFINADTFVSTGQGILGHNMFAYCKNNPVLYSDSTGNRAQIWPVLFGDHYPGYIHRQVQLHIIASGIVLGELYFAGVGRADIYDLETKEMWEIKHAGSIPIERMELAGKQVGKYIEASDYIYHKGHAGAFTGGFVINCDRISYLITYDTPTEGVILYYVEQMYEYVYETEHVYVPLALRQEQNVTSIALGAGLGVAALLLCGGGGGILGDPLCYRDWYY